MFQKVPEDWDVIAQTEAERICETFRAAGIDVLINADEMFLKVYPDNEHVIAPEGAKRVGSTIQTDEKKGLTAMLGMEFFSSTLLPPFLILDGATDSRLSKQWSNYEGPAKVCFQKSHWMDKVLAKKFLSWVKSLFPGRKIGIIWDKAAAHISEEVQQHTKELGIVIELLYVGMTFIMQPCDIWLNKAVKTYVRRHYSAYKNSMNIPTGQKLNVPREQIVRWIKEAVAHHNNSQNKIKRSRIFFSKMWH